jgi:MSHA biogenesis protein MshJ
LTDAEAVLGRASADTRLGVVVRPLAAGMPGLTLVALKTLPVETLFQAMPATPAASAASAPRVLPAAVPLAPADAPALASAPSAPRAPDLPSLYRHGVELTVQGRYLAIMSWLDNVEHAAPGLFWGPARLDATTSPDPTLKLTLYILSVRPDLLLE